MSRKKELLTLMNIDVSWLDDDVIGENILSFEDLKSYKLALAIDFHICAICVFPDFAGPNITIPLLYHSGKILINFAALLFEELTK